MMRSKTRVLPSEPRSLADVPPWSSDGLATGQGDQWEYGQPVQRGRLPFTVHVILKPIFMCPDPFRAPGPHKLVLCECLFDDGSAPASNYRASARLLYSTPEAEAAQAWFGFEQEYTLMLRDGRTLLGW